MTAHKTSFSRWIFWGLWTAVNSFAFMAAWALAFAVLGWLKSVIAGINEDHILGFILGPLVIVLPVVAQWIVLRQYVRPAASWIAASIAGWILTIAILYGAAQLSRGFRDALLGPAALLLMVAILGLGLGGMQWLFLRRRVHRAGWYVLASMLGWLTVLIIIGPTINYMAEIVALGTVPAIFTGAALAWLFGHTPPSETRLRQQTV